MAAFIAYGVSVIYDILFSSIKLKFKKVFVFIQVPANHLLIASIMSAPAALTISKVIYPETKQCLVGFKQIKQMKEK